MCRVVQVNGRWSMTKKHEKQVHNKDVLDIMCTQDLFEVETLKQDLSRWKNFGQVVKDVVTLHTYLNTQEEDQQN